MATKVMKTISIYRGDGKDGIVWEREVGEEASQEYKAGAPLVYDATSKELEEWAGGEDATLIVGVAAIDATGTTGSAVPYYEANAYNLFEASLINDTVAYELLGTELGVGYSLIKSGTDWYVDVNDTTSEKVVVVGLIDKVGDTNPRVIVRFLYNMRANDIAQA
jgi:hypothetical protein